MKCKNLKLLNALCVVIFMLFGCTQPESPHVHTFSEAWTTDATSHWHAATCEHTTEVSGKVDHQFPETWKQVTAATEEAAGLEERFCEVCNYRATQVIPQLNHNHNIEKIWSIDSTKHWHAASCGRTEHNEDVASHSWNHEDYQYDSVSGKNIRTCTDCLYVDDIAHVHTEDTGTVTSVPSCTTTGIKTYKCTVCNGVVRTEELLVRGHSEDSGTVTTPATCVTKGIKTYKCTVCRGIVRTEELPVTSHTEDSGTVITEPTCGTKGVKTFKCSVCNVVLKTEDIPATGLHTENSGTVTTKPTCVTKGVKTFKCSVCNAVLRIEDIPETDLHTEDSGTVTTPVTLTTEGIKTYKCTVCKAILRTEKLKRYEFTKTVKVLPAGTDGTAGTAATYVEFGDWPQSVLPSDSTVTVDETKEVIMGANTYYLGSDGNYYTKCTEKAHGTGDEYKYHDGTQPGTGARTTRYFKVEPIKWRVLTDNYSGKKLLLAENILTAKVPYYKYNNYAFRRTVGSDTDIYHGSYKYSQIRAYLNGLDYYYDTSSTETTKKTEYTGKGFLQTAFTQSAQALIVETDVDIGKETTDKIFLLSREEVSNRDYGFAAYNSRGEGNTRIRFPTDYAKANYAYQSWQNGEGGIWWLRGPGYSYDNTANFVTCDGGADNGSNANNTLSSVVPALSISF